MSPAPAPAPVPPVKTTLTSITLHLDFPTRHSITAKSHLQHIIHAANRTHDLTVVIASNAFWVTGEEGSEGGGSGSVRRSLTASNVLTGGKRWHALQSLLVAAYEAATKVFREQGRPLSRVNVVLEEMRGLKVCAKDGGIFERIIVDAQLGSTLVSGEEEVGEANVGARDEYPVVALGGTFDHLHVGHKILLTMAAFITTKRLIVGVSDTSLLKTKKFAHLLESIEERQKVVTEFLELIKPGIIHDVVPIQDVYGPTRVDPEITAIVVSEETRGGGEAVNTERAKNGLNELDVFVIPLVGNESSDPGVEKMGSTGIRRWIEEHSKRD